jgi:uncharacterized protein involved in exopolysaccharide biosynthesis
MLGRLRHMMYAGVDLGRLPDVLWRFRAQVLALILGLGVIAGGGSYLLSKWFPAGATFTIDTGQTPGALEGGLLSLTAQFGLGNLPTQSPQFYADLLASRSLRERLLAAAFPLGPDGEPQTLFAYWGGTGDLNPKKRDKALIRLAKHFSVSADARTGLVGFQLEGPRPDAAKLMADTVVAALNDLVIAIRRKRASSERRFLEERWSDLRDSLDAAEETLRRFYERNRLLESQELRFEELRLRRVVDRVQGVYTQVGTQLEQARIQEVRDTPALSVIDPPVIPSRKSAPKRVLIVLTAMALGALMAVLWALLDLAGGALAGASVPSSPRRPPPG